MGASGCQDNESPAKDRIVYQFAMQLVDDAENDLDIDRFDDGV